MKKKYLLIITVIAAFLFISTAFIVPPESKTWFLAFGFGILSVVPIVSSAIAPYPEQIKTSREQIYNAFKKWYRDYDVMPNAFSDKDADIESTTEYFIKLLK